MSRIYGGRVSYMGGVVFWRLSFVIRHVWVVPSLVSRYWAGNGPADAACSPLGNAPPRHSIELNY